MRRSQERSSRPSKSRCARAASLLSGRRYSRRARLSLSLAAGVGQQSERFGRVLRNFNGIRGSHLPALSVSRCFCRGRARLLPRHPEIIGLSTLSWLNGANFTDAALRIDICNDFQRDPAKCRAATYNRCAGMRSHLRSTPPTPTGRFAEFEREMISQQPAAQGRLARGAEAQQAPGARHTRHRQGAPLARIAPSRGVLRR